MIKFSNQHSSFFSTSRSGCSGPSGLRRLSWLLFVGCIGLACGVPSSAGPRSESGSTAPALRIVDGAVEMPAIVTARSFEGHSLLPLANMAGYHLIVWDQGKASGSALFRSQANDVEVLEALEALGLAPGNGLGMDTWEERKDPDAEAPEETIAGPIVDILVRLPGRDQPLELNEILEDPGGHGFEMRFGGHRDNIPAWHSGCVACLYSCPGSKVGNARYTVRDYVDGATRFRVRSGVLPKDGETVTLILRPRVQSILTE